MPDRKSMADNRSRLALCSIQNVVSDTVRVCGHRTDDRLACWFFEGNLFELSCFKMVKQTITISLITRLRLGEKVGLKILGNSAITNSSFFFGVLSSGCSRACGPARASTRGEMEAPE